MFHFLKDKGGGCGPRLESDIKMFFLKVVFWGQEMIQGEKNSIKTSFGEEHYSLILLLLKLKRGKTNWMFQEYFWPALVQIYSQATHLTVRSHSGFKIWRFPVLRVH